MGASEPARMEPVLDSFFRRSKFLYECWAATSAEVILTHDDFVWTEGPFMDPDIYRNVIIPRYAELLKITHAAGKKQLFCSDANYSMFVDDLAEAGADGFIFEPVVDFEMMSRKFGDSHCLIGSCVDCRDMTLSYRDKVKADIDKTFECLERCRGAIVAVGNHLPANIPGEMLDLYFAELLPAPAARLGEDLRGYGCAGARRTAPREMDERQRPTLGGTPCAARTCLTHATPRWSCH